MEECNERGASAVEYGVLIAGVAALIAGIVFTFGVNVGDLYADFWLAWPG